MTSLSTPIVVGASNTYCTLDPSAPTSTIPAHLAKRSGVVPAHGRALIPVSVPSDLGPFMCILHVDVQDNVSPPVLGSDWFALFNEYVTSQGPLESRTGLRCVAPHSHPRRRQSFP